MNENISGNYRATPALNSLSSDSLTDFSLHLEKKVFMKKTTPTQTNTENVTVL